MAKEQGVSKEEIGAAQSIVMAVSAGQIRAQFREVRRREAKKTKRQEGDGPIG